MILVLYLVYKMKGTANPFLFVCREATFRHELMILMLTWELLLLCIITDPFIAVLGLRLFRVQWEQGELVAVPQRC